MATTGGTIGVKVNGQTVTVNFTGSAGGTPVVNVSASPVTLPYTISADTDFAVVGDDTVTVSLVIDGVETFGKNYFLQGGQSYSAFAPALTREQLAALAALNTGGVNTVTASSTAQTIPSPTVKPYNYITLTGNCTFTFPTATAGQFFRLALKQDATGSRTATWPAAVKWAGGTAPTLTTTAAHVDYLTFECLDGATWAGKSSLDVR